MQSGCKVYRLFAVFPHVSPIYFDPSLLSISARSNCDGVQWDRISTVFSSHQHPSARESTAGAGQQLPGQKSPAPAFSPAQAGSLQYGPGGVHQPIASNLPPLAAGFMEHHWGIRRQE